MLFRFLALQSFDNLSDEVLEYEKLYRCLFFRFLRLQTYRKVKDITAIWCKHDGLAQTGREWKVFANLDSFLSHQKLRARKEPIVDASVVKFPFQPNSCNGSKWVRFQKGNK